MNPETSDCWTNSQEHDGIQNETQSTDTLGQVRIRPQHPPALYGQVPRDLQDRDVHELRTELKDIFDNAYQDPEVQYDISVFRHLRPRANGFMAFYVQFQNPKMAEHVRLHPPIGIHV